MAKTSLGCKALSVFVSAAMVVSLNPVSALAGTGDAGDVTAAAVQAQENSTAEGGSLETEPGEAAPQAAENAEGTEAAENAQGAGAAENAETSLVVANGTGYATLEEAFAAAEPDANGTIKYEINGKVEVTSGDLSDKGDNGIWIQMLKGGLTNVNKVEFVGNTTDAEICIPQRGAVLADRNYDIDVSFSNLTLTKLNPDFVTDIGHGAKYFTTFLRNTNAADNIVTYTNCTFPNGVCNNQYGNTVFENCTFNNGANGFYNLWVYGGKVQVEGGTFTGTRGVKVYSESNPQTGAEGPSVSVDGTSFTGLTEKAAVVVSKAANVSFDKVNVSGCAEGLIQKDIENPSDAQKVTIAANGTGIAGNFAISANTDPELAKSEFGISAGTFISEVSSDYLAEGFELSANGDGTYGVKEAATAAVAEIKSASSGAILSYSSLQAAIDAATTGQTVWLKADITENVAIDKGIILNGGGHTITNPSECTQSNGFNVPKTPSIKVTAGRTTVKNLVFGDKANIVSDDNSKIMVRDCTFAATKAGNVRTPIAVNALEAEITGNTFAGEDLAYYNPIEFTQSKDSPLVKATVSGNHFTKKFSNNGISVYSYVDGATIDVLNNDFVYVANGLRVSDYRNVAATFNVDGNRYESTIGGEYAGFFLLENLDNSNRGDFSKLTFNVTNMTNNSGSSQLFYVYDDAAGIATDQNPAVTGDATVKDMTTTGGVSAFAAEVDGKYFSSLQAAVDAATAGQTVKMVADATESIEIAAGKQLALDLNGKTLTNEAKDEPAITIKGDLTVVDSTAIAPSVDGSVVSGYSGGAIIATTAKTYAVSVKDGGTFKLESGKLESEKYAALTVAGNASGSGGAVLSTAEIAGGYILGPEGAVGVFGNGATVNITGGVLEATDNFVVAGNGNPENSGTVINISGGNLVGHIKSPGYIACGVYHPQNGKLNISGGSIYADGGVGVLARAGQVSITGGTIQTTGNAQGKVGDSAMVSNCFGVYLDGSSDYPAAQVGGLTATISGGSVETETADVPALSLANGKEVTADIKVTGGTYSTNVEDYAAEGYVPTTSTDESGKVTYGVAVDTESGWMDVTEYRSGETFTAPAAEEGMVFAGWYTDKECTAPLGKDVTTGAAYPKFVEISNLIQFEGGSLRMDVGDPATSTYLRFGYTIKVPDNCRYVSNEWDYYKDASTVKHLKAYNNLLKEDGTAMSNLVITNVKADWYEDSVYSQMSLTFKTADGTAVTAKEGEVRSRTVREVAEKILANPMATDDEIAYAEGVVAACKIK